MTTAAIPTVYARDMYAAQGFTLPADDRANLIARAAAFRALITDNGGTAPTAVAFNLPVIDPTTGATVGQLTYTF